MFCFEQLVKHDFMYLIFVNYMLKKIANFVNLSLKIIASFVKWSRKNIAKFTNWSLIKLANGKKKSWILSICLGKNREFRQLTTKKGNFVNLLQNKIANFIYSWHLKKSQVPSINSKKKKAEQYCEIHPLVINKNGKFCQFVKKANFIILDADFDCRGKKKKKLEYSVLNRSLRNK